MMKLLNMKILIATVSLAAAFGCSLFLPKSWDKNLCQDDFWRSAGKKDVAAIENPNHSCPHEKIIHLATRYASPEILREFLKKDDVNINAKNHEGYTPLILAARYGRKQAAKELLAAGSDVDKTNKYGNTALSFAARFGHTEMVKDLLDCGANVNLPNNIGNTPLLRASHFGHSSVVRKLIAAKANVNGRNKAGQSALSLASLNGHTEVIQQLIDAGSKTKYSQ